MAGEVELSWQGSLFDCDLFDCDLGEVPPLADRSFASLQHRSLVDDAWVDYAPDWLDGSDGLFAWLIDHVDWVQPERPMYGQKVTQPRLSAWWSAGDDAPTALAGLRECISKRYEVDLPSIGVNLYRDGRDSVAWHGDRIARVLEDPIVAIVSLGEPRRFLLRPRRGGPSLGFKLGHGDLLVMGGTCQRTWQHSIPKVAAAGARISVTFRQVP
jgi:alkylated DNA repair dioxygenase AlkB